MENNNNNNNKIYEVKFLKEKVMSQFFQFKGLLDVVQQNLHLIVQIWFGPVNL